MNTIIARHFADRVSRIIKIDYDLFKFRVVHFFSYSDKSLVHLILMTESRCVYKSILPPILGPKGKLSQARKDAKKFTER